MLPGYQSLQITKWLNVSEYYSEPSPPSAHRHRSLCCLHSKKAHGRETPFLSHPVNSICEIFHGTRGTTILFLRLGRLPQQGLNFTVTGNMAAGFFLCHVVRKQWPFSVLWGTLRKAQHQSRIRRILHTLPHLPAILLQKRPQFGSGPFLFHMWPAYAKMASLLVSLILCCEW